MILPSPPTWVYMHNCAHTPAHSQSNSATLHNKGIVGCRVWVITGVKIISSSVSSLIGVSVEIMKFLFWGGGHCKTSLLPYDWSRVSAEYNYFLDISQMLVSKSYNCKRSSQQDIVHCFAVNAVFLLLFFFFMVPNEIIRLTREHEVLYSCLA